MPRINLLPIKEARKRDTAKNELLAGIVGFVVLIVGLYAWYGITEASIAEMEERLKQVDLDISALDLDVAKVKDFKDKQQTIEKKLQVIESLVARKVGPGLMLDELAAILTVDAKKVWLTSLNESNGKLTLSGGAMGHDDISEFQLALERGKFFSNVKLEHIRTKREDDVTILEWGLVCTTSYTPS